MVVSATPTGTIWGGQVFERWEGEIDEIVMKLSINFYKLCIAIRKMRELAE